MSSTADSARRYLIQRPRALQYFHKGVLRKETEGERQAGRFELFLDLLYVALAANFADALTEHPTGPQVVKYILIFTPAWHAWSEIKQLSNAYYNEDLTQRLLTLWFMALLVLYGNNAVFVDEEISALRATVGFYLTCRFTAVLVYAVYSTASHFHQAQDRIYAGLSFLGMFLWTPMFFESVSLGAKVAVAFVAIAYETVNWAFCFGPWLKRLLKLEYSTAVDIPHEVDRAGAFYTIVLGEFLYYIIVGSPAAIGLNIRAMRAIWTLVIAFCLNSLYCSRDGSIVYDHPLRRSVYSAMAWIWLHTPLNAALLIGGHICAVSVVEEELSSGKRWLWGGGLGIGVLVLFLIAACFDSKDPPGTLMAPKLVRIAPRLAVAIVFALLPLASEEHVTPTDMLSIGAGLTGFLVIWETVTSLEKGACVLESWEGRQIPRHERLELEKSEHSDAKGFEERA